MFDNMSSDVTTVLSKSHELEEATLQLQTYFHCLSYKPNTESDEVAGWNKVTGSHNMLSKTMASSVPHDPAGVGSSSGFDVQTPVAGHETQCSADLQDQSHFR